MVFVGIVGPGYSGRHQAMNCLLDHGFRFISIHKYHTQDTDNDKYVYPEITFPTPEELNDFVLERYKENWVTVLGGPGISASIEELLKEYKVYSIRPFYLTLGIDSTLQYRRKRILEHQERPLPSENALCNSFFSKIYQISSIIICHDDSSLDFEIGQKIKSEFLPKLHSILRPPWDVYFMQLCILASHRSNCMKRRVGAVLVSSQSHRIISTGYNGTPIGMKNCNDGGCPRCNDPRSKNGADLSTCICLHAEENVLLEAGRERIQKQIHSLSACIDTLSVSEIQNPQEYAILYCTTCPCIGCAKKIIQCGIREVVYLEDYHFDKQVSELFKLAKVSCRQMDASLIPKKLLS
jgi:dCMP deaminase